LKRKPAHFQLQNRVPLNGDSTALIVSGSTRDAPGQILTCRFGPGSNMKGHVRLPAASAICLAAAFADTHQDGRVAQGEWGAMRLCE
jgi:hypothetical protein